MVAARWRGIVEPRPFAVTSALAIAAWQWGSFRTVDEHRPIS